MAAVRTRGHPGAIAAIRSWIETVAPHAVLIAGPAGVGKTTLADDLAAGLLCTSPDRADRPCGSCRSCRMIASGNHPDLHRLAPEGPGGQIRIGDRVNAAQGTIRRLVADLALLPVEGGARIAVVEHADRMNEDAQSALLKTLEEPPAGVTIVLCADEEERLLPTVRSRCARIRVGAVAAREIEALLAANGAAEPPAASRLARVAAGRPGIALGYAAAPGSVEARAAIARTLLDLLDAGPGRRLAVVAALLRDAGRLAAELDAATHDARLGDSRDNGRPPRPRTRRSAEAGEQPRGEASSGNGTEPSGATDVAAEGTPAEGTPAEPMPAEAAPRAPAAERRRAAILLTDIWTDLTRDLAVAGLDEPRLVRDTGLLDDLRDAAGRLAPGAAARFLDRLAATGELLAGNVSPELAVDVLALAWPATVAARAG